LSQFGELTELEGLTLEGSMWVTQHVRALAPIGKLTNLRYLSITNLRSDDKTLAPLCSLHNLENFDSALWWDKGELLELRRQNPRLVSISALEWENGKF
jgi:hypothetical protein